MAKHGFDAAKLARNLDRLLGGWVEEGKQPCVRSLVIRYGEVAYDKAFGWANIEEKRPLAQDSIFRIYSMTKVFTSVAMLMLLEEGRYKMHDPLSRFVPEFANTMVADHDAAGHETLVKPRREIIIRDLFTMASGIPYPGDDSTSSRQMGRLFASFEEEGKKGKLLDVRRMLSEVAKVPLTFHPGEHWWYGFSIDILGALVEVISGKRLGDFFKERIFAPLGLEDTGFFVPEEKLSRFITMYDIDDSGKMHPIPREKDEPNFYMDLPFQSGGGGLTSTAADVGKFARMLLGFGEVDGVRLLIRKSVELMRMNHLSDQQMADYNWDTQRGYGYGLAVRTMLRPEIAGYGTVGEFAWDGMPGTWFSVDPAEDMVNIFLVQTIPGRHYEFVPNYAATVYGAIAD